jgi:hypothetical protein
VVEHVEGDRQREEEHRDSVLQHGAEQGAKLINQQCQNDGECSLYLFIFFYLIFILYYNKR